MGFLDTCINSIKLCPKCIQNQHENNIEDTMSVFRDLQGLILVGPWKFMVLGCTIYFQGI